jgi:hypothetical protein
LNYILQIKQDVVTCRDSNPCHLPPTGWPAKFWLQ